MDHSENSHSLGVLINFGKLKILDLGDLTWDKEMLVYVPEEPAGRSRYSGGFASWISPKFQSCIWLMAFTPGWRS